MLALYIQAEKDVIEAKEVTINGRVLKRENLDEIRTARQDWQSLVNAETATSQGGNALYSLADFSE